MDNKIDYNNLEKILILENIKITDGIPITNFSEGYCHFQTQDEYIKYSIKECIPNFKNKKYTPKTKDNIYFHKSCKVPRYKVKSWGENYKIKTRIKPQNCQAIFVNDEWYEDYIYQYNLTEISIDTIKTWVEENFSNNDFLNEPDELINFANSNGYDKVYYIGNEMQLAYSCSQKFLSRSYNSNKHPHTIDKLKSNKFIPDQSCAYGLIITGNHLPKSWGHSRYIKEPLTAESRYRDFLFYLNNPNTFNQNDIISEIYSNSAVLDENTVSNLQKMFNGSQEDKILALETLSNCNVTTSLYEIMCLIRDNAYTIKCQKESNHIGFKSLISYIGLSLRNYTDDEIIDSLISNKQLTKEILKQLALNTKSNISKANSKHFKVKTIEVSDEVKEYFGINVKQKQTVEHDD